MNGTLSLISSSMARQLMHLALAMAFVFALASASPADETVSGNLTVTGRVIAQGTTHTFGQAGNASNTLTVGASGGNAATINITGTTPTLNLNASSPGDDAVIRFSNPGGGAFLIELADINAAIVVDGSNGDVYFPGQVHISDMDSGYRYPATVQAGSADTDTAIAGVCGTSLTEAMNLAVGVTSGKQYSVRVTARIANAAGAKRTYTGQVRRGGSSCASGSTEVESDGYGLVALDSGETGMLNFEVGAADTTGLSGPMRLCLCTSNASGTQTVAHARLTYTEF